MSEKLFEIEDLCKYFSSSRGRMVKAVDRVSFDIMRGETLGVVGESGCGKSTLGRTIIRILEKSAGKIVFKGRDLDALSKREFREIRPQMQIVFQDPFSSLDPRKTVFQILAEPFEINMPEMRDDALREKIISLMECVGLLPEHVRRYPHEFSGGQRQRIGIARAIALAPEFIVCDEPVSALDVSIQAQIINLFEDLRRDLALTYLFISHDLRVIHHISDRVIVMYLGRIVESGDKDELFSSPRHPYTRALLSAIPTVGEDASPEILVGEIPSPLSPPSGCPFHPRCRHRMEICSTERPADVDFGKTTVACHLWPRP